MSEIVRTHSVPSSVSPVDHPLRFIDLPNEGNFSYIDKDLPNKEEDFSKTKTDKQKDRQEGRQAGR